MTNCRAKRSEIRDSGVLVEYVWVIFDLTAFKVIWGSIGTLEIFRKYDFQIAASSTLMILLQPNVLHVFPVTVHTKVSLNLEI